MPENSVSEEVQVPLPAAQADRLFNPKAESPSIRKTPGIDHSASKPLTRSGQHVPPSASQALPPPTTTTTPATHSTNNFTPVRPSITNNQQGQRVNMVNPSLDQTRRIGAPSRPGSPMANRGTYRPPTMKRPLQGEGGEAGETARTPLADISSVGENGVTTATMASAANLDAKRQKMLRGKPITGTNWEDDEHLGLRTEQGVTGTGLIVMDVFRSSFGRPYTLLLFTFYLFFFFLPL